jgi:hypothetical protein
LTSSFVPPWASGPPEAWEAWRRYYEGLATPEDRTRATIVPAVRFAFPIYVVGFSVSIAAMAEIVATGWATLALFLFGLAVFAAGIVVEEKVDRRARLRRR